jgi:hypothetical protein
MTYRVTRSSFGILDFLLLRMKEEALTRPPRRRENNDKLSRTLVMAAFHSTVSGLVVGRSSALIIFSLMKARSNGGVGRHRMRIPRGMEMKPRANEMSHSRLGIGVTWKAAPPTNTMRICPPISTNHH